MTLGCLKCTSIKPPKLYLDFCRVIFARPELFSHSAIFDFDNWPGLNDSANCRSL